MAADISLLHVRTLVSRTPLANGDTEIFAKDNRTLTLLPSGVIHVAEVGAPDAFISPAFWEYARPAKDDFELVGGHIKPKQPTDSVADSSTKAETPPKESALMPFAPAPAPAPVRRGRPPKVRL